MFLYMLAMACQTVGPNGLNFLGKPMGTLWTCGTHRLNLFHGQCQAIQLKMSKNVGKNVFDKFLHVLISF